jgi:hypothetical protein
LYKNRGRNLIIAAFVLLVIAVIIFSTSTTIRKNSYTVTIKLMPTTFQYNGVTLKGYVEVLVNTPNGLITRYYTVSEGEPIVVEIEVSKNVLNEWRRLYTNAVRQGYVREGKPLPTIALIPYLYDDEGNKYIGTYSLSSATYLLFYKKMGYLQAVEKASKNPFLLFEEEPSITIKSSNELHIREVRTALPSIVKERLARKEPMLNINSVPGIGGQKEVTKYLESGSRGPILEEVWFNELYETAYKPPHGWLSRIYNSDDACKRELWRHIATVFSRAYYYPAISFNAWNAINAVVNITGVPEGIYSLSSLVQRIAQRVSGACAQQEPKWNNSIRPGFKLYNVPIVGAKLIALRNKPVRIGLVFTGIGPAIHVSGITYGDRVIDPVEHVLTPRTNGTIKELSLYAGVGSLQGFIFVPTLYYIQSDGAAIMYHVSRVSINGCTYYRVVPILIFTPLYMQYYMALDRDKVSARAMPLNAEPPPGFKELVWHPHPVQMYKGYLYRLVAGETIYENKVIGSIVDGMAAAVVTNTMKTPTDMLVSGILGSSKGYEALASVLYTILGSLLGHAEFTAGVSTIGALFRVETSNDVDGLYIAINKMTLECVVASICSPLLSYYVVTVS